MPASSPQMQVLGDAKISYDKDRNIVIADYRHLPDVCQETFKHAYQMRAELGIANQKVLILTNPDQFSKLKKLSHPTHNQAFSITAAMAFVSKSPIDNLFFQEYAVSIGKLDCVKSFRDEPTAIAWLQQIDRSR